MGNQGHAKLDANHAEIAAKLEQVGAAVLDLSGVGQGAPSARGAPDLLVWFRGSWHLIEVKTADGRLTPNQKRWRAEWRGPPPATVRSIDEALALVGVTGPR